MVAVILRQFVSIKTIWLQHEILFTYGRPWGKFFFSNYMPPWSHDHISCYIAIHPSGWVSPSLRSLQCLGLSLMRTSPIVPSFSESSWITLRWRTCLGIPSTSTLLCDCTPVTVPLVHFVMQWAPVGLTQTSSPIRIDSGLLECVKHDLTLGCLHWYV